MTRRRISIAAATLAVALGVASPLGVAAATRVVDNDGRATLSACDATRRTLRSVQGAIEALGAGDSVKVCPGTYVGRLTMSVQNNTIRAVFNDQPAIVSDDRIEVRSGARATLKGNSIVSTAVTDLSAGIDLVNAHAATLVEGNTITGPDVGIRTVGNGYTVKDNTLQGEQLGIHLSNTDDATVTGNRSTATHAVDYGISANEASDSNDILGNDVHGSFGPDCHEADSNASIDNTWSGNTADDSSPPTLSLEPPG